MQGRRRTIAPGQDPLEALEKPGDYCGPVMGWSGDRPAVFFLLPIEGDKFERLHHVVSPPHRFVEELDGSLSVYESIEANRNNPNGPYWHGYLKAGVWQSC